MTFLNDLSEFVYLQRYVHLRKKKEKDMEKDFINNFIYLFNL